MISLISQPSLNYLPAAGSLTYPVSLRETAVLTFNWDLDPDSCTIFLFGKTE